MGEVYRAHDSRLDRDVAIKILPAHLASNSELRQRFEREARAISALGHPNICTLFDVGHQDGIDFLVMEYLEGETLAHRLNKGALPLDLVFKWGAQIAEALESAHRQGILHRDLKPANIMITKTGAKLMDFGLAKSAGIAQSAVTSASGPMTPSTPTMSLAALTSAASPLTQKGQIVGTFQYLAPEVLQGAEADARSDIFSFGCVLYEMATGRRAFEGKSQLSVLTAILEKDPEPVSSFRSAAPRGLEHIIHLCLAKDPDSRIASTHDLKLALEWLHLAPTSGSEIPGIAKRRLLERAIWSAVVLLCLAGIGYIALHRSAGPVIRSSVLPPKGSILDAPSSPGSLAVAPDGSAVVFSAVVDGIDKLYLRRLHDTDAVPLAGTEEGRYPFWSPDSRSVGFFTNREMRRIDLSGGPPVTICDASNGRGGAWAQDGTIYFVPATASDLMRVPVSGGAPEVVLRVDRPRHDNYRWPVLLPDGKHLLVFAANHGDKSNNHSEIIWSSTDGTDSHVLVNSGSNAEFSAGFLLFTRGGTLMAQKLDYGAGRLTGRPQVLVEGIEYDPSTWRAAFSIDSNGAALAYIGGANVNLTHLMWLDRAGKPISELTAPELPQSVRFSRAGNKLLTVSGAPRSSVWISDLSRKVTMPFTFEQDHQSAVWSPDGKYIAYCERGGTDRYFSIWIKAVSGTEPARRLTDKAADDCPADWSPDGKLLAYVEYKNNATVWFMPVAGGKPFPLFDNSDPSVYYVNPMFSSDGRWLALVEGHQGRNIVEVVSFPEHAGKWQVSTTASGLLPFWRPDSKELFYVGDNNELMAVEVDGTGTEFRIGATHAVARLDLSNAIGSMQTIDISPDRKGFAAVLREGDSSASLTLVQNFVQELKE
jgi:serine/threonine protein kinase/Tol biopolymer transport system component